MDEDSVRRLRPIEAFERDIVAAMTRAVVTAEFWVDLGPADRWLNTVRVEAGAALTYTHLYVKAAAAAAMATPRMHRLHGPLHVVEPAHADVGVSVAAEEALAPVVVIRRADQKSLSEISRELTAGVRKAKVNQRELIKTVDRYLRLVPIPPLRRLLIRACLLSPNVRRRMVGTIQLSDLSHFAIDNSYIPLVTELLLVATRPQKRVLAEGDNRLVVATGAQFTLHASHRKINGVLADSFIRRFQDVMAHPEQL